VAKLAAKRLRALGYMEGDIGSADTKMSGPDPKDRISEFEEYGRALMLSEFGRIDDANVLLERLLGKLPDLVDPSLSLGFNKQRQGQYAESVDFQTSFEECSFKPNSPLRPSRQLLRDAETRRSFKRIGDHIIHRSLLHPRSGITGDDGNRKGRLQRRTLSVHGDI
jgi:hypothetical protein